MVPIRPVNRLRSERGAELIEFALVFPLLLLVILGIVDFGFLFQRMEVVTNAAREGARVAVLPGYANADAEARVTAYITAGGLPPSQLGPVNVTDVTIPVGTDSVPGKRVSVTYFHNYMFLGPMISWFGGSAFTSVPVRGLAVMRDEG